MIFYCIAVSVEFLNAYIIINIIIIQIIRLLKWWTGKISIVISEKNCMLQNRLIQLDLSQTNGHFNPLRDLMISPATMSFVMLGQLERTSLVGATTRHQLEIPRWAQGSRHFSGNLEQRWCLLNWLTTMAKNIILRRDIMRASISSTISIKLSCNSNLTKDSLWKL
jgi:hypothetical protein